MAIDYIDTPRGTVYVGQLQEFNEINHGCKTGHYPYTTLPPTFIPYNDILPFFEGKSPTWSKFELWSNLAFPDREAVAEALEGDTFRPLVTDIYWIWGAPDVGGIGICKTGDDSYSVVYINGYYQDGDVIRPRCNSLNITNVHGATISNAHIDECPNIPPVSIYPTGITFYCNYTVDSKTGATSWDGMLRFNAMSVLTCSEGYDRKNPIGERVFETVNFTDVGTNLETSWSWNYDDDPYTTNVIDHIAWVRLKNYQWSIDSFYPYWGLIDPNADCIEGTSIFGGESVVIDDEGNPYEEHEEYGGGGSTGGLGPQSRYSEDTLPEGHPALNLLNSGFVKLYNPTLAEVQRFASFLFSGITEDMSAVIKRMMVNPIDYILALNMIHIPLTTTNPADIGFCGISSGVSAAVVTEQYYEVEYTLDIKEFWQTALDYSSYTKCKVYVPYCGIYEVSIDEIQNGTLWLRFVIDCVSGSVVAFLGTKRKQKGGTWLRATLAQYNGNCILSMPVSSTNWQNTFSSVLNIANMAIAPSPSSVAGMAQNIMSQKVSVQKSGSLAANFGYLGKQTPYVILERPELSIPTDYGHHEGYPANHKRKMSEVHGYTEVKENTLIYNKFSGTDEEMEMLKSVLESGVYLD